MNKSTDKAKKKKIITIVIISIVVAIALFIFVSILPFLIFAGAVIWDAFFNVPAEPNITHGEFPFELVYEYKGNTYTIQDTIICDYEGYSYSLDGGNSRDWDYSFKNNEEYGCYYIDKDNEPYLYILVPSASEYYMGVPESSEEECEPYIIYMDEETGTNYNEKEEIPSIGVKIIKWTPSKPLVNQFK